MQENLNYKLWTFQWEFGTWSGESNFSKISEITSKVVLVKRKIHLSKWWRNNNAKATRATCVADVFILLCAVIFQIVNGCKSCIDLDINKFNGIDHGAGCNVFVFKCKQEIDIFNRFFCLCSRSHQCFDFCFYVLHFINKLSFWSWIQAFHPILAFGN